MLCPECMMNHDDQHVAASFKTMSISSLAPTSAHGDGMRTLFILFKLHQPQIQLCSKLDFSLVAEKCIPLPNTTTTISLWIPVWNSPTVNYPNVRDWNNNSEIIENIWRNCPWVLDFGWPVVKLQHRENPRHRGDGLRYSLGSGIPEPYPYLWNPWLWHRGVTRTRVTP